MRIFISLHLIPSLFLMPLVLNLNLPPPLILLLNLLPLLFLLLPLFLHLLDHLLLILLLKIQHLPSPNHCLDLLQSLLSLLILRHQPLLPLKSQQLLQSHFSHCLDLLQQILSLPLRLLFLLLQPKQHHQ